MGARARIKFISEGFAEVLKSDGDFQMVRGVADGIALRARTKTRVHVFRGRKDGRPIGAVWTDASNEFEAYDARKKLRGAV